MEIIVMLQEKLNRKSENNYKIIFKIIELFQIQK